MSLLRAFGLLRLITPRLCSGNPCSTAATQIRLEDTDFNHNDEHESQPEIQHSNENKVEQLISKTFVNQALNTNTETMLSYMQTPIAKKAINYFKKHDVLMERTMRVGDYRPSRQSCNGEPLNPCRGFKDHSNTFSSRGGNFGQRGGYGNNESRYANNTKYGNTESRYANNTKYGNNESRHYPGVDDNII